MSREDFARRAFLPLVTSMGLALLAWFFVPLLLLKPALPGILVALAMLGAAVLVRLARNAPITTPAAFDEEDLTNFFDALQALAKRLVFIFIQVIATILLVFLAMILVDRADLGVISSLISAVLVFMLMWLGWRLIEMVLGDIGFLRLQRQILENALKRERVKVASKVVESPIEYKSTGMFGRVLE